MTEDQKSKRLTQIDKDIKYLKSVGISETSDNETMKKLVAERTKLRAPPITPKTERLAQIDKDIEYLKSVGLTETSDNETMKKLVEERNSLTSAAKVPVVAAIKPPEPASTPVKKEPWSLCSIKS
jgi:hypothetical protein